MNGICTQSSTSRFRFFVAVSCLAFLVAVPAILTAQEKLPNAKDILNRHVEACGGMDAFQKLKTRKITGTFTSAIAGHNTKAEIVEHSEVPNRQHLMMQGDHLSRVRVADGENAWEWRGDGNHSHGEGQAEHSHDAVSLLEGPEKKRTMEQAAFHDNIEWQKQFKAVETTRETTIDDKPAWEVKVTTHAGDQYSQFFDKESGRLVKYKRTIESTQMGSIEMEVLLQEYRQFDDVWLATKIVQNMNIEQFGEGNQIWTYNEIEHNVDVPESLFEMPEEVKQKKTESDGQ